MISVACNVPTDMPAEYRAYVPPREPGVIAEQRAAAHNIEAPDFCLSGEHPLHRKVNNLSRALLRRVYDDSLPSTMEEPAKALGRLTEQLLFQTEDTYDQSHRTRKAVPPSPEHLAQLGERWTKAADIADQFVTLVSIFPDEQLRRELQPEVEDYARTMREIAEKVQAAIPKNPNEQFVN